MVETELTILFHSHVPHYLWIDAFATAVFLLIEMPTNVSNYKSSFQMLFHLKPAYDFPESSVVFAFPLQI